MLIDRNHERTLDIIDFAASAFAKHVFAATIVKVFAGVARRIVFLCRHLIKKLLSNFLRNAKSAIARSGLSEEFLLEINDQERETVTFGGCVSISTANRCEVVIAT